MPFLTDNSQLQTFKDCPEQYRLHYCLGLKKIEEGVEEHDKNFGGAIHGGLEAYYKKKSMDEVLSVFKQMYPDQMVEDDFAKTQENGLKLFEMYDKHYREEDKGFEVLGVEVKDKFDVCGVQFIVKIDLIIRQQGCVYFMDHKTTKKPLNWSYWSRFEPNAQLTTYTAYCRKKYGECSGGLINAIRFGHRQRAYKGEPAGFYCEFQRQLFNRNAEQIRAWEQDTLAWSKSLQEALKDASHVWCKNEGQCQWCSYKEVCISCADEQIIDQLYKRVDPKEYLNADNKRPNQEGAGEANN